MGGSWHERATRLASHCAPRTRRRARRLLDLSGVPGARRLGDRGGGIDHGVVLPRAGDPVTNTPRRRRSGFDLAAAGERGRARLAGGARQGERGCTGRPHGAQGRQGPADRRARRR